MLYGCPAPACTYPGKRRPSRKFWPLLQATRATFLCRGASSSNKDENTLDTSSDGRHSHPCGFRSLHPASTSAAKCPCNARRCQGGRRRKIVQCLHRRMTMGCAKGNDMVQRKGAFHERHLTRPPQCAPPGRRSGFIKRHDLLELRLLQGPDPRRLLRSVFEGAGRVRFLVLSMYSCHH